MGGRAYTIEFTITGLTSESQADLMKQLTIRLGTGQQLLYPAIPEYVCYEDGESKPVITCTMDPPLDVKLIPSAVCTIKSMDDCSAVVIRSDAEQVLVEILESSGPSTMQPGERRMVARADVVPDGTYLVLNREELDPLPYGRVRRARRGMMAPDVALPL